MVNVEWWRHIRSARCTNSLKLKFMWTYDYHCFKKVHKFRGQSTAYTVFIILFPVLTESRNPVLDFFLLLLETAYSQLSFYQLNTHTHKIFTIFDRSTTFRCGLIWSHCISFPVYFYQFYNIFQQCKQSQI